MKNWFFVPLALFLVILSSGCTVPGLNIEIPFLPDIFGGMNVQEQRHDVISIDSVQMIPSATVRSGQSVHVRAVIKNLQSPEYPKVHVTIGLFNDCGLFGLDTGKVEGELCSGSTAKPTYNSTTRMSECAMDMHPQSTALVEWKLTAQDVNVETQCKLGILAKYNYTTYSTTSVTFVNKAELERIISEGKSFSETGTATIGEGPVKSYVEVLSQPLVIDPAATGDKQNYGSGIMSFWVENKGSGILDIDDSRTSNVMIAGAGGNCNNLPDKKICISISSTSSGSAETVSAISSTGNNLVRIENCVKEHLKNTGTAGPVTSISFIGKSTPKYACSITATDPSRVKEVLTQQIKSQVTYWYKFVSETPITVQPKIKL
jgi:hypothetical protein